VQPLAAHRNALYGVAAVALMIGALFAFVLPRLQA
jgi:hypothetical protein